MTGFPEVARAFATEHHSHAAAICLCQLRRYHRYTPRLSAAESVSLPMPGTKYCPYSNLAS